MHTLAATGQHPHGSLSMGSMLDTAQCPMLENDSHCPANDTTKIGLNKVTYRMAKRYPPIHTLRIRML